MRAPDVPDDTDLLLLLAADASPGATGTLDVRGLGWWLAGPAARGHSLLVWLTAPAHRVGTSVAFAARLVDADGRPVTDDTGRGPEPIGVRGRVTVPEPDGLPAGLPVLCPPLHVRVRIARRLPPGVYEWRGEVEGRTEMRWRRGFVVRESPPG